MKYEFLNNSSWNKEKPLDSTLEVPINDTKDSSRRKGLKSRLAEYNGAWRTAVLLSSGACVLVLLLNIAFTIVIASVSGFNNGQGVLFDGSCAKAKQINTALHLLINVLGTILLSASNYSMQILTAPTRKEVNQAHARSKWLYIGVPGVRNLLGVGRWRAFLWLCLGLSSAPLQLFYNSSVFQTIQTNQYAIITATESFLDPSENISRYLDDIEQYEEKLVQDLRSEALAGNLERLEPLDCINGYARPFQGSLGNVILIVNPVEDEAPFINFNLSALPQNDGYRDWFSWVCNEEDWKWPLNEREPCGRGKLANITAEPDSWEPNLPGQIVEYCLSERLPEHCKVKFSQNLIIVVIIFNFIKAVLMAFTALKTIENPILNIGDAVSSFLQHEDKKSRRLMMRPETDLRRVSRPLRSGFAEEEDHTSPYVGLHSSTHYLRSAQQNASDGHYLIRPRKARRWYKAASRLRRLSCFVLSTLALALCAIFLRVGLNNLEGPKDVKNLTALGFGAVNPQTMIVWGSSRFDSSGRLKAAPEDGNAGLMRNALAANLPQLIVSFLYFLYNGLFTSMLQGLEWNQYSYQKKGLRVSARPQGSQRTTYFLQLPYRYGVPLMFLAGVLHWLVSQSIFLVNVEVNVPLLGMYTSGAPYNARPMHLDRFDGLDMVTCGYSPTAIVTTIVFCVFLALFALLTGLRRYKSKTPPIVGSSSELIAAACHFPRGGFEEGAAHKQLQWGLIRSYEDSCYGFSSKLLVDEGY